jgi:hypothetical protein
MRLPADRRLLEVKSIWLSDFLIRALDRGKIIQNDGAAVAQCKALQTGPCLDSSKPDVRWML